MLSAAKHLRLLLAALPDGWPQSLASGDRASGRDTSHWGENYTYDNWGNLYQTAAMTGLAGNNWTVTVNANNQLSNLGYDAAGNLTGGAGDGNYYAYDAEGRVCAVSGPSGTVGYIYDAEGNRVAKGNIHLVNGQLSCDIAQNGFQTTANGVTTTNDETDYVLGPGGEQVTEVAQDANGSMNWQRTYVYAGGALVATYGQVANPQYNPAQCNPATPTVDPPMFAMPSFRFTDWLGTMRATTDAAGVLQGTCVGLPYGDGLACGGNIPDPHHFTGKERDSESGNDYFGARYYASSMGRFLSPDWSAGPAAVPYADLQNPQSLNLYEYAGNNPLNRTDPTGHWCIYGVIGTSCTTQTPPTSVPSGGVNPGQAQQQNTEVAQNGGGEKLNIDKMVQSLDANAKGVDTYGGKCAGACHKAMAAGGIGWDKNRPSAAGKNGPWLVEHGASPVGHSDTNAMPGSYTPMKGDIAVFSGGAPHNPIGHMEIYDGKQWVSDTRQTTFSPGHHYPGSVTIYRFPQQ